MSEFINRLGNLARSVQQRTSVVKDAVVTMISPKTSSATPKPTNTDSDAARQRRIQRELAMRQEPIVTHALMEHGSFEAPSAPANSTPTNPTPIIVAPPVTVSLSPTSPTA